MPPGLNPFPRRAHPIDVASEIAVGGFVGIGTVVEPGKVGCAVGIAIAAEIGTEPQRQPELGVSEMSRLLLRHHEVGQRHQCPGDG